MKHAVIDMGTNSTRLAVGSLQDGRLCMEFTEVVETRLGEGMGLEQIIQPVPLQRNITAVQRLVKQAQELDVQQIRITATSAVREAVNQQQVQDAIALAVGIPVEVLPGTTEARLSYLGASGDFLYLQRPLAVLDIGGGSTELVYPAGDGIHGASVHLGAVRLLEHPELRAQTGAILAHLKEEQLPDNCALIAVGGTNTCLMAMELGLRSYDGSKIHGRTLQRGRVDFWCQELLRLSQAEREQIPGMKAKRADIMPYGVLILQQVMELLQVPEVTISDKGLVYGLLMESFGLNHLQ